MKRKISTMLCFVFLFSTIFMYTSKVNAEAFIDNAADLSLPDTLEGTLNPNDELVYSIKLTSDGTLNYSINNYGDPNDVHMYFKLYDENANEVHAFTCYANSSSEKFSYELKKGTYFLKIDNDDKTGDYKVTLSFQPTITISLCINLKKGDTLLLSSLLTPSGSNDKTIWITSKKSVATVSSNGKITAVSAGTATITAKTSSGSKTSIIVKVK